MSAFTETSNSAIVGKPIVSKVAIVAAGLGLWGALVLLFATQLALTGSASLREALGFAASFWALWLLFLPAVAWISFRFPIERRRLVRNLLLHILACLLLVATNRAGFHLIDRISRQHDAQRRSINSIPRRLGPPAAFGVFQGLRAALDVLVYWSLVGVCQAVTNFRRSQERERRASELEARLGRSKLQALRMQINPHFLFNTLNSIATLVHVDPAAADEMLTDLSELLRSSLDSMEEQEIPLAQELKFIGAYLNIEQKRFGERLRLEQSVPDDLMRALVPALVLQPLVENAIRHGIEPQRAPGLISIEARHDNKRLRLTVRDNGRGLPGPQPNGTTTHGIGLANIQARLQGLYGENQSFTVSPAEPQGCQVEIHLPLHLAPIDVTPAVTAVAV